AVRRDVGFLSGLLGNGVSARRDGRVADSNGQAQGPLAPYPRLYRTGRGAVARRRGGLQAAAATRGRVAVGHRLCCRVKGRAAFFRLPKRSVGNGGKPRSTLPLFAGWTIERSGGYA